MNLSMITKIVILCLQATGQRIGTVVQSVATLGLAMGLALSYEWRLGLVALCFTPLILVSTYFMMRVMHGNAFGTQDALEKSTKVRSDLLKIIISSGQRIDGSNKTTLKVTISHGVRSLNPKRPSTSMPSMVNQILNDKIFLFFRSQ